MSDLTPGQEFAGYLIEDEIGHGGMGVVYRAREVALDRMVAIKVIAGDRANRDQARARFEREARLMAAIDHPNVIPVYGAGEQDGHLYLVMRYVDGTDLQQLLRAERRLSPARTAQIFGQVAGAVGAAHARGLVHRDIKPGNVLLSGEHAYLADFGITRVVDQRTRSTDSGQWIGTVDFMSPEHLRGEPIDQLSDIYSLGALLYCCLAGTAPFHRATAAATITAQLHDRPPRPSAVPGVGRKLDKVVARALAKRPADRYQSAEQLAAAVAAAVKPGRRAAVTAVVASEPAGTSAAPAQATRLDRTTPVTAIVGGAAPTSGATGQTHATDAGGQTLASDAGAETQATDVAETAATRVGGAEVTLFDQRSPAPIEPRAPYATAAASHRSRRRGPQPVAVQRPRRRLAFLATALVVLALAVGGYALLTGSSTTASGPLGRSEIGATIRSFAAAYSARDSQALAALLATNVTRVSPSATQYGKAAVLAEYRQQFSAKPVPRSYVLGAIAIQPGWAGRASADYTLTLTGPTTVSGHVVFGLERVNGKVLIGLIATS